MRVMLIMSLAFLATDAEVSAGFSFSTNTGDTVERVDRSALFDWIEVQRVGDFVEDGLALIVSQSNRTGFDANNDSVKAGFHFGQRGKGDFLTLIADDDGYFAAVEFALTSTFLAATPSGLFYEVLRDGIVLDYGFSDFANGTIAGFHYDQPFDQLRLAAAYTGPHGKSAVPLSIHQVKAEMWGNASLTESCPAPVPEPGAFAMMAISLGAVASRRMLRAAKT